MRNIEPINVKDDNMGEIDRVPKWLIRGEESRT
jgi:hypothetical protein